MPHINSYKKVKGIRMKKAQQAIYNNTKRLFHYQDFDKERLEDTLLTNRIYCSNPIHFNDPWDMKPLIKTLDNERDRSEYIEYLRNAMINNDISQDVIDKYLNTPSWVDYMAENSAMTHWKNFEEFFRVYCLTPKSDNLLMWSHYANKHHGICLEFDTDNQVFGGAWEVEYHSEYPYHSWKSDFDIIKLALTKAKCWEYEEEYRLLPKTEYANQIVQQDRIMIVDKQNKITFPSEALKSIIIGCKADYEEIKNFIHSLRPDLQIKRAIMQRNRYGINIE